MDILHCIIYWKPDVKYNGIFCVTINNKFKILILVIAFTVYNMQERIITMYT